MRKIFTVLMMLFAGFFATAEIIEDGYDNCYIIMNDKICNRYYCDNEGSVIDSKAKMDRFVKSLVDRWGLPDVYIPDNKELDSEVAEITKKHGFSITWTYDCRYIVNVYYKGKFRLYVWR